MKLLQFNFHLIVWLGFAGPLLSEEVTITGWPSITQWTRVSPAQRAEEFASNDYFVVYENGKLAVQGDENRIWLKGEAKVTGNANTIYVEESGTLEIRGHGNRIFFLDGSNVEKRQGAQNAFQQVEKINFVAGAPANDGATEKKEPEVASASGGAESEAAAPPPLAMASAPPAKSVEETQPPAASPPPSSAVAAVAAGEGTESAPAKPSKEMSSSPSAGIGSAETGSAAPAVIGNGVVTGPVSGQETPGETSMASSPGNATGGSMAERAFAARTGVKDGEGSGWEEALASVEKFAPSVGALVAMLPGGVGEKEASPVIGNSTATAVGGAGSVLLGTWEIESVATTDSMLKLLSLNMEGTMSFFEDGSGMMDAVLSIKGLSLDKAATFNWEATDEHLIINSGAKNESRWSRRAGETPDIQEATVTTDDGTILTLRLKRIEAPPQD